MRIVFDLDGTLANTDHRLHHIQKDPKDWDAFFDACGNDLPILENRAIFRALRYMGHTLLIWSGRSEGLDREVRNMTIKWLRRNGIILPDWRLRMRQYGDHRPDDELKRVWLQEARMNNAAPTLVFEDRKRVVDMWRREGITCHQVAPGDF